MRGPPPYRVVRQSRQPPQGDLRVALFLPGAGLEAEPEGIHTLPPRGDRRPQRIPSSPTRPDPTPKTGRKKTPRRALKFRGSQRLFNFKV